MCNLSKVRADKSATGSCPIVVPIASSWRFTPGGFMTDQRRREALSQSSPGDSEPRLGLAGISAVGWRHQTWYLEQEKEWNERINDLQRCVCELLIKNQQLRELLASALNHQ